LDGNSDARKWTNVPGAGIVEIDGVFNAGSTVGVPADGAAPGAAGGY